MKKMISKWDVTEKNAVSILQVSWYYFLRDVLSNELTAWDVY